MEVHSSAIISPEAKIGENVSIGAYSIIGPNVEIGNNVKIHPHVVLDGHTTVGDNSEFFQFCSIGAPPQDLTYKGEATRVEIGKNNIFREYVSVHRGTRKDNQLTKLGDDCLLMAHVHIGHDVIIGNHCVLANSVNLAGHVHVGDRVTIGGGTQVSQFIKIGRGAYIGGASGVDRDIPLFCTGYGNRVKLKGINIIGLRRNGYSKQEITEVVDFYRTMEASALSPRSFIEAEAHTKEYVNNELVQKMIEEIQTSKVGLAPFIN